MTLSVSQNLEQRKSLVRMRYLAMLGCCSKFTCYISHAYDAYPSISHDLKEIESNGSLIQESCMLGTYAMVVGCDSPQYEGSLQILVSMEILRKLLCIS